MGKDGPPPRTVQAGSDRGGVTISEKSHHSVIQHKDAAFNSCKSSIPRGRISFASSDQCGSLLGRK